MTAVITFEIRSVMAYRQILFQRMLCGLEFAFNWLIAFCKVYLSHAGKTPGGFRVQYIFCLIKKISSLNRLANLYTGVAITTHLTDGKITDSAMLQ